MLTRYHREAVANPHNGKPVFASFGDRIEKAQVSTSFVQEEQNQGYCSSLICLVEGRRSLHTSDEDLPPPRQMKGYGFIDAPEPSDRAAPLASPGSSGCTEKIDFGEITFEGRV